MSLTINLSIFAMVTKYVGFWHCPYKYHRRHKNDDYNMGQNYKIYWSLQSLGVEYTSGYPSTHTTWAYNETTKDLIKLGLHTLQDCVGGCWGCHFCNPTKKVKALWNSTASTIEILASYNEWSRILHTLQTLTPGEYLKLNSMKEKNRKFHSSQTGF